MGLPGRGANCRRKGFRLFSGGVNHVLAISLPGLNATDLNLALVAIFLEYGCRTGSPTTAPSIRDDGLIFGHFRQTTLQFRDRDVRIAFDSTVLLQFLGRSDI